MKVIAEYPWPSGFSLGKDELNVVQFQGEDTHSTVFSLYTGPGRDGHWTLQNTGKNE